MTANSPAGSLGRSRERAFAGASRSSRWNRRSSPMACPTRKNLETALMLEETVRAGGATPATIAVIEGRFKVGLDRAALEGLSRLSGGVVKASRRDLAAVVARHGSAGTTVAATMYIAELAGHRDFRDRRHRRRASRRRGDVRHFRRSRRTRAQQGRRRLRRREIDPRYRQDAGISGIAGRRGLRLSLRRIPGVLCALQRRQARPSLRRRRAISRAWSACSARSAPAAC